MPNVLARLRAAFKTFVGPNWIDSELPGNIYSSGRQGRMHWIPGTQVNWDRITGDLWECPAVQSCLNWIYRNFLQAPPIVEQKDKKGEWSPVPDHPLLALLNRPNPQYDWGILAQGIILSLETNGNAYVILERTGGNAVSELWYAPHTTITPYTLPGGSPRVIDYYDYWLGPKHYHVPPEDVLHIKYGIDPLDQRLGLAPLASASRDVNALQQAGNYRPTILRNFGVIGRVVWPDDPNVILDDPQGIKNRLDAQSQGDLAGSTVLLDFKAGIEHPKVSAQDMALETIEDRPEADICSLIGIPIQVTGLHGGREAKTYANMKEAREAAWEEKLIPLGSMLSQQIGHRLLPEFLGIRDPKQLQDALSVVRMNFDYRDIRPLQPDLDALHSRALKDWLANLLTLAEWCQIVGRPDPPADVADMRFKDFGGQAPTINEGMAQQGSLQDTQTPQAGGKAVDWAERVINEIAVSSARNGH